MFWKNTAWSWDDTAGAAADDDDGGFLLAADLRGTLDSAPDADRNQISTVSTSASNRVSAASSAGAKELGRGTLASSRPLSLDSANCISYMTTNSQQLDSQDLRVSSPTSEPPSVRSSDLG